MSAPASRPTIGYLGPHGTFTEEALLRQTDLAGADLRPCATIPEVLHKASGGELDLGFVAIENSIDGSVRPTTDTLVFDSDLLIQREVVMDINLNLLGLPGTRLDDVERVMSYPVALGQCRGYLREHLPHAVDMAANSTARAAERLVEMNDPTVVAIGTNLAAEVCGLEVLAPHIEDRSDNQTRFVLVSNAGVPAPTGHDKTSLVVFQRANEPGSLLAILHEFAARGLDMTKLESRPSKRGLGDYCFLIDVRGHVANEVMADALRELKMTQADVKFLGSYPVADGNGPSEADQRTADANWRAAHEWVEMVRSQVGSGVPLG